MQTAMKMAPIRSIKPILEGLWARAYRETRLILHGLGLMFMKAARARNREFLLW